MPKLSRSDYYDLTRDMNWHLKYVTQEETFPPELAGDISLDEWWKWDELHLPGNGIGRGVGVFTLSNASPASMRL